MPRKSRVSLSDGPCHVLLRGKKASDCFFTDEDYLFFLECLKEAELRFSVQCYAYVLMPASVHLILSRREEGVEEVVAFLMEKHSQYAGRRYERAENLWEPACQVSLIESRDGLLTAFRYIEMVPVLAGQVRHPSEYEWSSYRAHAYGEFSRVLVDHAVLRGLHHDPEERRFLYRSMFETGMQATEVKEIEKSFSLSGSLGSGRFDSPMTKAGRTALHVA